MVACTIAVVHFAEPLDAVQYGRVDESLHNASGSASHPIEDRNDLARIIIYET
jgi:hypothetical protein